MAALLELAAAWHHRHASTPQPHVEMLQLHLTKVRAVLWQTQMRQTSWSWQQGSLQSVLLMTSIMKTTTHQCEPLGPIQWPIEGTICGKTMWTMTRTRVPVSPEPQATIWHTLEV
jgi:hypothetical protein